RWQRDGVEQAFAYLDALQALSDNPARWPSSTADLPRVVIDLRFRQTGLLRRVRPRRAPPIELPEYPGGGRLDPPPHELGYGPAGAPMRAGRGLQPPPG